MGQSLPRRSTESGCQQQAAAPTAVQRQAVHRPQTELGPHGNQKFTQSQDEGSAPAVVGCCGPESGSHLPGPTARSPTAAPVRQLPGSAIVVALCTLFVLAGYGLAQAVWRQGSPTSTTCAKDVAFNKALHDGEIQLACLLK